MAWHIVVSPISFPFLHSKCLRYSAIAVILGTGVFCLLFFFFFFQLSWKLSRVSLRDILPKNTTFPWLKKNQAITFQTNSCSMTKRRLPLLIFLKHLLTLHCFAHFRTVKNVLGYALRRTKEKSTTGTCTGVKIYHILGVLWCLKYFF